MFSPSRQGAILAAGISGSDAILLNAIKFAHKGIERVDAGDQAPPDLLLLDLNLPRIGGEQVLERVRQSRPCAGIAVVVITSSDSPHDRQRAADLGAAEYFRKPANLDEFMALGKPVRRLAEKRHGAVA